MELDKSIRICDLISVYGHMLSKKQQEIMREHFYNDCSLSEIAENQEVTRQAVLDAITKSTTKLEEFESKLHLLEIKNDVMKLKGATSDKKIISHLKTII